MTNEPQSGTGPTPAPGSGDAAPQTGDAYSAGHPGQYGAPAYYDPTLAGAQQRGGHPTEGHPTGGYPTDGYPGGPAYWGPPAAPPVKSGPSAARRTLLGVAGAALAAGLVLSGVAIGNATESSSATTAQGSTGTSGSGTSGTSGGSTSGGSTSGGSTSGGFGPGAFGGSGSSGTGSSGTTSASVATATQQKGIVTIVSVLGYQSAESAGTGMILTSDGEILTNNHVIDGATSITVTVETTGKSYKATVVGTDATDDVAVLQLTDASGLTTASVGSSSDVDGLSVGDSVTGVGNANGTGTLTTASGTVTALNKTITASDESGSNSETLEGLIETNAPIISGDSGGPLYDSDGNIIGIDTAGSSGSQGTAATSAYAIPIDDALAIADKIEAGVQTSDIRIGLPAFLGVGVANSTSGGAAISSVVSNGPAAQAGITAGSTITAVGGTTVSSATGLSAALAKYSPGNTVSVTWRDSAGTSHTATVTLVSGPAA